MSVKKLLITLTTMLYLSTPAYALEQYKIDPVHSSVVFKIKHKNASYVYGRFNNLNGTVIFDEKNPSNSKVDLIIKAADVDTNNQRRDNHLRSPDFFNAKQYPDITFKSTTIKKINDMKYEVSGNLTIHGVTKQITTIFERTSGKVPDKNTYLTGGETSFVIDRTDFGVNYGVGGIGKDVTLFISLEGSLQ